MIMNNYSWVTLLSGDNYINGVLGLNYSLKQVKSKYPLYVIVSDCSKNILKILDQNEINYQIIKMECFKDQKGPPFTRTLQKLKIFDLKQFDKVIFLDTDIIVLKNIDYYFNQDFGFMTTNLHLPDNYIDKNMMVIGQCFLLSPNKINISYEEIKEKYQNIYMNDEEVLTELYINKILPNQTICPISDRLMINYEGFYINEPKWFHDNSLPYKKLFFCPNYYEIIDNFQLNLSIPEEFQERQRYIFDEIY